MGEDMISVALAGAPTTKLLAGSDGHGIPETHWYGALCWKRALQNVLQRLESDGFVDEIEAQDIGARVLHENARNLYALLDLT